MDEGFRNLLIFGRFMFPSKKISPFALFWFNLVMSKVVKIWLKAQGCIQENYFHRLLPREMTKIRNFAVNNFYSDIAGFSL